MSEPMSSSPNEIEAIEFDNICVKNEIVQARIGLRRIICFLIVIFCMLMFEQRKYNLKYKMTT